MTELVVVGKPDDEVEKTPLYKGRRLISHSESDAYGQCEQKHSFAHEEKLQPKKRGSALARGSAGHLYLETFLQATKDGMPNEAARKKALHKVAAEPNAAEIIPLVTYWAENIWPTLGWRIIEVEYEFEPVGVSNTLAIPGKIDLIAEVWNATANEWQIMVIDHKFLYDPYPVPVFDLLPQIPKYIGILRSKGMKVKGGIFNVMRTRKLNNPNEAYKLFPVYPTNAQIKRYIVEQVTNMNQIEANAANPEYIPVRTVNKMNCANCGFLDLCLARAQGRDTKLLEKIDFEPNTYGYTEADS